VIPPFLKYAPVAVLLPMLAACAPAHFLIERADVSGIEQRLDGLDDRYASLEHQQEATREQLSVEHRFSTAALMQTMVAEFAQLSCDPAPAPQCIADSGDAGSAKTGSRTARTVLQVDDKQVIGGVEKVLLSPPGQLFEARIDTGAESASLDARNIQEFERDGNRWVRFSIVDRETDELIEIERRVVRYVRILQSLSDQPERRPVVRLRITLGDHSQTAEFTLSDRSHLSYSVLIGRNVLQDLMLVDVSRKHIAPPEIPAQEQPD
jgi:hypothetical protein